MCREPEIINQDSKITKYILADNRSLWIGSIYISKGLKKNLVEVFSNIKDTVSEKDWSTILVGGDWNIDAMDKTSKITEALLEITKQMGLTVSHGGRSRGNKTLDFIVSGREIQIIKVEVQETNLSDHYMIIAEVQIPIPKTTNKQRVLSKEAVDRITTDSIRHATNSI